MSRVPLHVLGAVVVGLILALGFVTSRGSSPAPSEEPAYPHGDFEDDCSLCHSGDTWSPAVVSPAFDHGRSGFPLEGAHAHTPCRTCHDTLDFTERSASACVTCHQDVHEGELGADCARCHTARSFTDRSRMEREHQLTRFPLTGMHAALECAECHTMSGSGQLAFVNTTMECYGCHAEDYEGAKDPDHAGQGFSTECQLCHGGSTWEGAAFDHSLTAFPLTGAHAALECASCHGGGPYTALNTACASCHQDDFDGTTDPAHGAAGFALECQQCHGTATWDGATFDHAGTQFPLTGAHAAVECMSCHGGGVYNGLATECASCHQGDYDGTTDPDHAAAGYPLDCLQCHGTASWEGVSFDHTATQFPLTGAHAAVECMSCHGGGVYNGLATECASCHQDDFDGTTDPDHGAAGFALECQQCHGTATWDGATFDHAGTQFPLTGAHVAAACASCHGGGVYNGLATECASCHQGDYDGTTDPDHAAAGYPLDCLQCHGTASWEGASFDHTATQFPLTGAHAALECMSCHGGGVYNGLATECASCHQDDFDGTTDPDHGAAGFAVECQQCHGTATWDGATFDHAGTQFPLTGAHLAVDCMGCHGGGVYNGLATECASCHQNDYDGTTDPDHAAATFPLDCQQCHGTASWEGASFDHNATQFPLTGAHAALECMSCHGGGVFNGLNTECAFCHQDDYDGTTDPSHAAAAFPAECALCHGTSTWAGAQFDHDGPYFPIYSGKHAGEWNACTDCHTNPTAFSTFSCLGCHPHSDQNKTDNDHDEVNGYRYDSLECYRCHPDGRH